MLIMKDLAPAQICYMAIVSARKVSSANYDQNTYSSACYRISRLGTIIPEKISLVSWKPQYYESGCQESAYFQDLESVQY